MKVSFPITLSINISNLENFILSNITSSINNTCMQISKEIERVNLLNNSKFNYSVFLDVTAVDVTINLRRNTILSNIRILNTQSKGETVSFRHKNSNIQSSLLERRRKLIQSHKKLISNKKLTSLSNKKASIKRIHISDPLSWHHSGLKGNNMLDNISTYARNSFIQSFKKGVAHDTTSR